MISIVGAFFSKFFYLFNSFLFKIFVLIDEPHEKVIANMIMILGFAIIYYFNFMVNEWSSNKLNKAYSVEKMNFFDALYFSFVVHFTLGFGDIFPVSSGARIIVIIHTTMFWIVNIINSDMVTKVSSVITPKMRLNRVGTI